MRSTYNFFTYGRLYKSSQAFALAAIIALFSTFADAANMGKSDLWRIRQNSSLIVRGRVISTKSYWKQGNDGNDIVTDITFSVTSRPKGNSDDTIIFQIVGGTVDDKTEVISSMPTINTADEAVVFLKDTPLRLVEGKRGYFAVTNSTVRVKKKKIRADVFVDQLRLEQADLEQRLADSAVMQTQALATSSSPVISSISPSAVSAGTNSQITITGSGFGLYGGYVEFTEDPDSSEMVEGEIVSWTDTQIKCIVPPLDNDLSHTLSSGPVKVTTARWLTAEKNIRITFAYSQCKWDNSYMNYYIKENAANCDGEGTAVKRAANSWNNAGARFAFYYLGAVSSPSINNDRNEIYWSGSSELDGAAAVTKLLYSGHDLHETDILFNTDYTWGTSSSGGSECDVETIALHELGHCVGLLDLYGDLGDGYDTNKVMFGISYTGDVFRTLSSSDVAGAMYIYGKQGTTLIDGQAVTNISGSTSSARIYRISVPSYAASLKIKIYGGTGNCNMYVRRGTLPSTTTYDYAAVTTNNTETVSLNYPSSGDYYILLKGASSYSGLTLLADYSMYYTLSDGTARTGISGTAGTKKYFKIKVPSGAARIAFKSFSGSGNCDLYTKFAALPTTTVYNSAAKSSSTTETTVFYNPVAGDWYMMLYGAAGYSDVSLLADYIVPGTLSKNVAVTNISGSASSARYYKIVVPSGQAVLTVKTSGGTGNCDLYVRKTYLPSTVNYDYARITANNTETISLNYPAGVYFIMLNGASSYSGLTLVASYSEYRMLSDGTALTGISGSTGSKKYFKIKVPAGAARIAFKSYNGSGNCDMYVKRAALPTTTTYDKAAKSSSSTETIVLYNPAAGDWYIMLNGTAAYSGVSLVADYFVPPVLTNNVAVTDIAGPASNTKFYKLVVPAGITTLTITTSGGTGNCDLYVRKTYLPGLTNYDYVRKTVTNAQTVTINSPSAGNYFIMIYGASAYSGVTLNAHY